MSKQALPVPFVPGIDGDAEVLFSLWPSVLERIRSSKKHYEYRRIFVRTRATAYVYVSAPVMCVCARLTLDAPVVAPAEELARIADADEPGSGRAVYEYLRVRPVGFAMRIRKCVELPPISLDALRSVFPGFAPPQSYLRLERCPALRTFLKARAGDQ